MSLPKQERKLWLEKCSPGDPEAKLIRQRMGIPPIDVLAVLSGRVSQSNAELLARVWPRHTIEEMRDPAHIARQRSTSDTDWLVRYKALGRKSPETVVTSPLENNSITLENRNVDSNETQALRETITPAQERELMETLQLSASEEELDDELSAPPPKPKLPTLDAKSQDVIRSAHLMFEGLSSILQRRISPLPPSLLLSKQSSKPDSSVQNSRTRTAGCSVDSKSQKHFRESVVGGTEKASKPSVYSPLAIRVTEVSSVSSQEQPSTDAVSTFSSLPVQRLSNRENVPSSVEKPSNQTRDLVRKVLADADEFCKPFRFMERLRAGTAENGIIPLSNDASNFTLKRVSPLPNYSFDSKQPTHTEPIPPPTKKRRRSSKDVRSETSAKNEKFPVVESVPEKPKNVESRLGLESLWVIPMMIHKDLGQRIHSIIPTQSSSVATSADIDKLYSIQFLLRGLRVPINTTDLPPDGQRSLTASVIVPDKPRTLRRFVECGTVTTPKRITASSTQYDPQRLINSTTQTVPPFVASVFTNTTPCVRNSIAINTDPVLMENGFSNNSSFDCHLKKLLRCNYAEIDRTIQELRQTTTNYHVDQATLLDRESAACWSALVKYVAATSGSSSVTGTPLRPFVCSCTPESRRLAHSLFCQSDFISYPEKTIAAARHVFSAAFLSDSTDDQKRIQKYENALEVLGKITTRLKRAEGKLLRRAWNNMDHPGSPEMPYSSASDLCEEAKRWCDLWYSALPRVRAFALENVHNLQKKVEEELRTKILNDPHLKQLNLVSKNDVLACIPSPSPPLRNGSIDGLSSDGKPEMCTVPFSTLKQLVKAFHISSNASESLKNQRESDKILPIDRFASSPSSSVSAAGDQKQLPYYLSTSSVNVLASMIVYIDQVLQEHRLLVECLSNCPEIAHYQVSINTTPLSKKSINSPLPATINTQSTSKRKRDGVGKQIKSPLPPPPLAPAFDPPPERQFHDPIKHRAKHRRRNRHNSSQSDETTESSEFASVLITKPALKKKKKHRRSPSPVISPRVVQNPAPPHPPVQPSLPRFHKKHRPVEDDIPPQRKHHSSRSSSVAPSRRHFEHTGGDDSDDSLNQRRLHKERKRERGRSVAPSHREKSTTPVNTNGDGGRVVETYSPRKNPYLYSPSRPAFSGSGNSRSTTYEPTYIPSVPTSPPKQPSGRRTLLQELPGKPSGAPFYDKWMNKMPSSSKR
ncbi:unnamed protein product [Hymenolepis diminuta]|uniref:Uncharacterized protein n=1 Tax=Hymenolepis diminuta TaxID=6216 RepID=A0A564YIR5_HYMDI|nr:unnamed protein product [Hymenolepis diminuta]